MTLINKEIAVLFPFNKPLSGKHGKGETSFGGVTDNSHIKALLPNLNIKPTNIISLLFNPAVRYGPENGHPIIINKNKQLELFIAGFPHKMPNPFFTESILPDMGELLYLSRLNQLAEIMEGIHPAGVKVKVCVEGTVFHYLAGVSRFEAQTYQEKAGELIQDFGLKHLEIIDLADLHPLITGWDRLVRKKVLEIKNKFESGDADISGQIHRTWPVMLVTLNVRGWPPNEIRQLFLTADKLSGKLTGKWGEMADFALGSTFDYLAYNAVKRETQLMEKAFPGAIKLTVTPKPGAFGIWWIRKGVEKLPYYGVPVVRNDKFDDIKYLHDLQAKNLKYYSYPGFADKFYYIIEN